MIYWFDNHQNIPIALSMPKKLLAKFSNLFDKDSLATSATSKNVPQKVQSQKFRIKNRRLECTLRVPGFQPDKGVQCLMGKFNKQFFLIKNSFPFTGSNSEKR